MPAEIWLAGTDLCSASCCHRLCCGPLGAKEVIPSVGRGSQAVTGKTGRADSGRLSQPVSGAAWDTPQSHV